ncbi:MBL fold metallo-hydrolase [Brevibacterium casei]|uniref:MBL fold metallo-hydrolase n=1 Tax=Brevibacterium casei TaxID=33889 RepID=UPI0011A99536|nr:MBL fold metallo-hydrolase [Brevibacterium casei]MBE4694255.1 MBL fold metallo-hydrolase [Brevibacterium casei]MBY3577378.1 MBL fold metallo-hydrolase [Brevibacterium casei]MCT2359471.1 MBL fold metallo-hydrolase [Brevibacterium casei]
MSPTTASPRVITLGVAGGPRWWPATATEEPSGIATAIVVGDAHYLVDCGAGTGRNLTRAGLAFDDMRAIFLTHLHSDHVADLAGLLLFSSYGTSGTRSTPVHILGPGDRGTAPPLSPFAASADGTASRTPLYPRQPTPGTADMVDLLQRAFATDLNDRYLDGLRLTAKQLFTASDIALAEGLGYHPDDNPTPVMSPFPVYEDDRVRVSATLVAHPPVAPAFGFRFETDEGTIVVSGDTTYTPNMVALAQDADLLLHEVIDSDWIEATYGAATDPATGAMKSHHLRSHTTVTDVLRLADEASVARLALHHIVPGTARPNIEAQLQAAGASRTVIARDREEFLLRAPARTAV